MNQSTNRSFRTTGLKQKSDGGIALPHVAAAISTSAGRAAAAGYSRRFAESVIPGRAEGANPESSDERGIPGWIPGSALRAAPE
ncbi:hypothetical protein [Rhodoplanes elegans]|uniref:hypothetical protein n=1 Tax=Rhodoplanes elegans TaxID=29408 RepID=UPI001913F0C1|nr:hypothetical protein [Rhodoplanes elegans]